MHPWQLSLTLVLALCVRGASACPFCTAVAQTIDEEMQSMDAAVLATLEFAADYDDESLPEGELPMSRFLVKEVLKGEALIQPGTTIEAAYFGPSDKAATYLLMATDPPKLLWGSPLLLSDRGAEYVRQITTLPRDTSRLSFFLKHLEDQDELLARDAYDEFAKAPYPDVKALKDQLDRKQLLAWISDKNVSVEHRRLYLTMLGICGNAADGEELAKLLKSGDPTDRAGLNAIIGAYLCLAGSDGLKLIDEQFLANDDAEYADIHAAIMALRFHGNETDVIPREDVIRSMRLVLQQEDIADLVVPDLARWEDWSVMPRLIELFEKADPKTNWVRVPVVNFVRACPLPEGKEALSRLESIDADAVRRASALFPMTPTASQDNGPDPSAAPIASNEPPAVEPSVAADDAPDPFANQAVAVEGESADGTVGSASASQPDPPVQPAPSARIEDPRWGWPRWLALLIVLGLALGLARFLKYPGNNRVDAPRAPG